MELSSYLTGIGLPLEREGSNYKLEICPFCGHKDCFKAKSDYWQCFSCKAAGDAYKFESLRSGISYGEAKGRLDGKTVVRLPNPLNDLIHRNHETLMSNNQYLKWLTDERKLSIEAIRKFKIGCFKTDEGKVHYSFPYFQGSNVANVKYRTADKKLIYFKKGSSQFLYNVNAAQNTESLLIVEGELDCLASYTYKLSVACISVGLGAGSYKLGWKDELAHIPLIYICFDTDEAGQSGARKLAQMLGAEKCRLVHLPLKDMNDCLKADIPEAQIEEAIKKAKSIDQIEIFDALAEILPDDPVIGDKISSVLKLIADRPPTETEDYIRAIKERFPEIAYRQLLDFRNRIRSIQHMNKQKLSSEVPVVEPEVIPEDIKREAMSFLLSPDILQHLQTGLTQIGLVGEDFNKVALWLFMLSRKQEKCLINSTVFGQSSSGKSEMVKKILETVPEEDIMEFTSMSAHALDYRENDLIGKVIYIAELNGTEDADYSLRVAMSENKIIRATTIKDEDTGEMRNVERIVRIKSVFVVTTTKSSIHQENNTRVFSLFADESMKQTQRVIEYVKAAQTRDFKRREPERTRIKEVLKAAQKLLEPVDIDVPYASLLEFPESTTRNRRDMSRFLSFIKVIAFLRQHQKEIKTDDLGKYIEADAHDYRLAHEYLLPILKSTLDEITPRSMSVLEVCCLIQTEKNLVHSIDEERSFTVRDVQARADERGVDFKNSANLRQELCTLCDAEYLELVSGNFGKRGARQRFKVICSFDLESDGVIRNIRSTNSNILSPDDLANLVTKE